MKWIESRDADDYFENLAERRDGYIKEDTVNRNVIYDGVRWERVSDAVIARLVASREVVRCTGDCVALNRAGTEQTRGDIMYHVMDAWPDIHHARLEELDGLKQWHVAGGPDAAPR